MLKICFRIVSTLVILFLFSAIFAFPPGALDTTFGTGGIASVPNGGFFESMAIQADGKIILGGTWNSEMGMTRLNADGSLDTSFGTGGTVKTDIFTNSFGSNLTDLAIQPDGKIIAVGYAHRWVAIPEKPGMEHYYEFAVVRYHANGSLDTTFDTDGIAITSLHPARAGGGESVALQPDGKIVMTAHFQGGTPYFTVFRYNPNGSPDMTFDGDGMATASFDPMLVGASDLKIQADGKIVVGGLTSSGFQTRSFFVLARFLSSGAIDDSFDNDGRIITTIDGHDRLNGLALQPDGKIVAAGLVSPGYDSLLGNFGLARYNANGSPDNTFDGDGKVSVSFGSPAGANDVVLQNNGRIVTAGFIINSTTDFALARYLPNGSLDTSFDGDGFAVTDIAGTNNVGSAVGIQPGGKIIVGGTAGSNFVAARYFAGASTFADFDGDGKSDMAIFRPSNGQWWLNRSSAGVYATPFGAGSDKITPGDFTGDGKTDIAFWRPSTGEWFVLRSEDGSYFAHPFGSNGDIPAPGDFDGDGKTDEAVFRPSAATWFILRSSGGTTIQNFGANGDVPVVGDYDGDGKSDIAIYRPSAGEWWVNRSSNGTTYALPFGAAADKPAPGDFTGDGKADVAFWRPSTGFWFVLRSEDFSYFSFPFGTTGDIAAPGDYDGDGKFDAAVFRPSNATWFIRGSTGGTIIQNFGATGDIPVESAFIP